VPVRASEAEAVLAQATLGTEAFQEAGQAAAKEIEPASDIHGSAEYRRHLAAVLVARALAEAAANGNGST
jgi:carbon-monoxide dehydrogenase medium subunit